MFVVLDCEVNGAKSEFQIECLGDVLGMTSNISNHNQSFHLMSIFFLVYSRLLSRA